MNHNINNNKNRAPARLPADAAARERAVTATDRNLVVVAGAGSGKTSLLVERILYLLFMAELAPSSWIALTFTEAAAAEMRRRVVLALDWLSNPREGREGGDDGRRILGRLLQLEWTVDRVRELAAELIIKMDPSAISTIHGYCSNLLRRYPAAAGVAPNFILDDGSELARFSEEFWPEVTSEASRDAGRAAELEYLLGVFDFGDLKTVFADLLNPACPVELWLSKGFPEGGAADWLRAKLKGAPERFLNLQNALGRATKFTEMLSICAAMARAVLERGPSALRREFTDRCPSETSKSTKVDAREIAWARETRDLLDLFWQVDEDHVARAVRWLCVPAAAARARRAREGFVTFDGLLAGARDLLRSSPVARRQECARLQRIFVDEFQDTDPLQYEILFFLAEQAGREPETDAWKCTPAPGKLFIVGDPKQSIYRFRGADMAAYSRAVERILQNGGELLELTVSFRSPAEILTAVDCLFSGWLDARSDAEREHRAAPEYLAILPHREHADPLFAPRDGEARVEVWSPASVQSDGRRAEEAAWIADDIFLNITKNGGRVRAGHHAILLRSFSNVAMYARALDKRGIPFVLEGGRTFYERAEVTDLRSWIQAIAQPADPVALLAVLRSAAGAVPDAELQQFGAARLPWHSLQKISAEQFPGIARVFNLLNDLREFAAAHPADRVIRELWDRTQLLELHAAGFDGAQRIVNLIKCAQLATDLARTRGFALDEVASELSRRANAGGEGERSLADGGVDAVQIFTIHGAKGLEFEIVYLADLARESDSHRGGTGAAATPEGALEAVFQRSRRQSSAAAFRTLREEVHSSAEERRLFYVAATRARERLILLAGDARAAGFRPPWLLRVRAAFLYDPTLEDRALLAGGAVIHRRQPAEYTKESLPQPQPPEFTVAAGNFVKLTNSVRDAARPPVVSPTGLSESRRQDEDERESDADATAGDAAPHPHAHGARMDEARAAGIAVHALLEHADFANTTIPLATPARIQAAARDAAEETGLGEKETQSVAADVAHILTELNKSDLRARLANIKILARELPLLADESGTTVHGFADLVFEESGAMVIADWKTDSVASDSALAAAIARHRDQIRFYQRTLARALQRPVRAELYFVRKCAVAVFEESP